MLRKVVVLGLFAKMLAPLIFASFALIPLAMAASILQSVPIFATLGMRSV